MRKLCAVARSPSALIYAGSLARAGFAFLLGVVLARLFGPADYGLFHAYMVLMTLTACLVGEAMDHGLIRHYTDRLAHAPGQVGEVLGAGLALRAVLLVLLGLVALAGASLEGATLAQAAPGAGDTGTSDLGTSDLGGLLLPGLVAGALLSPVMMLGAIYLSEQRFLARAALLPIYTATRFVVVGGAAGLGLAAMAGLIWLDVVVAGGFAALSLVLMRRHLAMARFSLPMLGEMARFSACRLPPQCLIWPIWGWARPC